MTKIIFPKTTSQQVIDFKLESLTTIRNLKKDEYNKILESEECKTGQKYDSGFDDGSWIFLYVVMCALVACGHSMIAYAIWDKNQTWPVLTYTLINIAIFVCYCGIATGIFAYHYHRNAHAYSDAYYDYRNKIRKLADECDKIAHDKLHMYKYMSEDEWFERKFAKDTCGHWIEDAIELLEKIKSENTNISYRLNCCNKTFRITQMINGAPFETIELTFDNPKLFAKITEDLDHDVLNFSCLDDEFNKCIIELNNLKC